MGRISASKTRFVTWNTFCSRLEAVSSGPNSRKLAGFSRITSRSQVPSTRVPSTSSVLPLVTSAA